MEGTYRNKLEIIISMLRSVALQKSTFTCSPSVSRKEYVPKFSIKAFMEGGVGR